MTVRTKAVWTTPQAFGSGAYWNTTPTGQDWTAMQLASFIHDATGSISFQYPTTSGNLTTIEGTAATLTGVITKFVQPFIVDASVSFDSLSYDGVDAGLWNNGTAYLLLVTNPLDSTPYVPWSAVGLGAAANATTQVQRVFTLWIHTNNTGLNWLGFGSGGSGIYMVTPPK